MKLLAIFLIIIFLSTALFGQDLNGVFGVNFGASKDTFIALMKTKKIEPEFVLDKIIAYKTGIYNSHKFISIFGIWAKDELVDIGFNFESPNDIELLNLWKSLTDEVNKLYPNATMTDKSIYLEKVRNDSDKLNAIKEDKGKSEIEWVFNNGRTITLNIQKDSTLTFSFHANDLKNGKSNPENLCREIAKRDYPNDEHMQEYIYNQQLKSYTYMIAVEDLEVKEIATREYPEDFSMQEYTYEQQSSAKKYMMKVNDIEVKKFALLEYPKDYSMQKYIYEHQLAAKEYMSVVANNSKKRQAIREYPNDYAMQKYFYDH